MLSIGLCSFSFHSKKFYSLNKNGVKNYLFRLQTEGSCEIDVNGTRTAIEKGDLLLLKPGEQYNLRIEDGQNSGDYFLFCSGEWIEDWWNRSNKPTISRIHIDEKILLLWRQIIIEERRPTVEKNLELINYLLQALCVSLERAVTETRPVFNRPPVVTQMMRFIEENAMTAFKIEDVSSHVNLSISRAVHLFKSSVGKTMIEYSLEIQLSSAIDQMKYTSLSLGQIAENCGFGSYPYFHKIFKRTYQMSPGVYRRIE